MNVKIYAMSVPEVEALLHKADAESFTKTGSHDNSCRRLSVNGADRVPRNDEDNNIAVSSRNSWHDVQVNDPGSLPKIILKAAILETEFHYGSNMRPRSLLRVFTRRNEHQEHFLVIDVGQVDSIFESTDLIHVLAQAKKLRVTVEGDLQDSLCPVSFSEFYRFEMEQKAGSAYLRPEFAQKWFEVMFADAKRVLDGYHALFASVDERAAKNLGSWINGVTPLIQHTVLGEWLGIGNRY